MLPNVNELSPFDEPEPEVRSSASNVIAFPVRHDHDARLERDLVLALATADDLEVGLVRVADRIRQSVGATGVDWWARGDDGAFELAAVSGTPRGTRHRLPLGRTGEFVIHGGILDPAVQTALTELAPIVRRRAAEESLARTTVQLARHNAALEDFAALVAHELKTPLQEALVAEDPSSPLEEALDLVESLLEAAQNEPVERTFASVGEVLDQVVEDLHSEVEITSDLATTLPLPPEPLRVILRNLLSNSLSADARHVHVAASRSPHSWRLVVDDDGVGLAGAERYAAGSGLGLSLSKRIAARFGGAVELEPRPSGGTRATLEFTEVAR